MTYKLNLEIGKIESPVILCLPSGERRRYQNGAGVVEEVFDRRFLIEKVRAVGDVVEVVLTEITEMGSSTWIGEEQTFF